MSKNHCFSVRFHSSIYATENFRSIRILSVPGSATLLVLLTSRSVDVSIMQLTCGCCTCCRADNLGNPLALLKRSSQLPQLWERKPHLCCDSNAGSLQQHITVLPQSLCLLIFTFFNDWPLCLQQPHEHHLCTGTCEFLSVG